MECFICAENHQPLFRVCKCNTVVHEKCFQKLVNVPSHATHCAVCMKQYDMSIYSGKKIHCHRTFGIIMFIHSVLFVATMFGILFYPSTDKYKFVVQSILGVLGIMLLVSSATIMCKYKQNTKHWCCIWSNVEPIKKVIHLPAPCVPTNGLEQISTIQETFVTYV